MTRNFSKQPMFAGQKRALNTGQAITEYLILTALIAVGSIAVIQVLGSNIQARLAVISEAIRGERKEISGTTVQEKHYELKDLGDFQESIRDNTNK